MFLGPAAERGWVERRVGGRGRERMCVLADGTDQGGSIRIPAAIYGVVGLRPTAGLVPSYQNPWLFDAFSVPGPLARRASDPALMLTVIAGADQRAPLSQDRDRALRGDALPDP